ncbi:M56 family metallopeptidase [Sphingomonas sp. Root241]|uniref:M56 family metallopeptidase n=1 Tax=Sphingomonas sp. Root241 TaxID=1736501 RepID=UPI0006F5ABAD|nr:M56 family metallopeptidase [Sphingomonas sp. Root241]KRC80040.1 hypothetical protein ASE13_13465 [Sphingomonas sp. Root241]
MLALLVDLGWKSGLIAGLALLANQLLRRRAPGERVALLRAGTAALLMLPLLARAGPEFELAVLPALETAAFVVPAAANTGTALPTIGEAQAATAFSWLLTLYLTGAGLLLMRLGIGLITLWCWTHRALPVRDPRWTTALQAVRLRRSVRLLVSPRIVAPMSWGLSPAWVLIGPATERRAEQAEAVIAHELAHVRRFDWPVLMASQLATLCFWFNPLVWLLACELARQTELAADEDAIRHVARADYAQTLLALAGGAAHPAGCGMSITYGALGRRIRHVLDAEAARPASRLVCTAMLICAPLAAAPLAVTQLTRVPAPRPAPMRVATDPPAPAIETYLPSLIPAAQAAEAPAIRRSDGYSRRPSSARAPSLVDTTDAKPGSSPERDSAGQAAWRVGVTPPLPAAPSPPSPPAPGTQAAAWQEALAESRGPRGEPRKRTAGKNRAQMAADIRKAERREEAGELAASAKSMRIGAQELEALAADGTVTKEIRGVHAREAASLREKADRLDWEARRKLFGG